MSLVTPHTFHPHRCCCCCLQLVSVSVRAPMEWFTGARNCMRLTISSVVVFRYTLLESFVRIPLFTRDSIYAIARICYRPSVRPSVYVTRVDHTKTVEVRIMKFPPYGSPIPLVFREQVSSRNSDGFPRAGALKGVG